MHHGITEAFILLIFPCEKFLVSSKISLEMSQIGKISTFCGQFRPFSNRSLQITPQEPTGL